MYIFIITLTRGFSFSHSSLNFHLQCKKVAPKLSQIYDVLSKLLYIVQVMLYFTVLVFYCINFILIQLAAMLFGLIYQFFIQTCLQEIAKYSIQVFIEFCSRLLFKYLCFSMYVNVIARHICIFS